MEHSIQIKVWRDVAEDSAAARFVGAKVARLREVAKYLGPGARITGKAGRTATFLGKHPDPDYLGDFWWRISEPPDGDRALCDKKQGGADDPK